MLCMLPTLRACNEPHILITSHTGSSQVRRPHALVWSMREVSPMTRRAQNQSAAAELRHLAKKHFVKDQ
jgi:hypothetical protein